LMAIAQAFMGSNSMGAKHGSEKKQAEREIYEVIEPQTKQTENELSEHSS